MVKILRKSSKAPSGKVFRANIKLEMPMQSENQVPKFLMAISFLGFSRQVAYTVQYLAHQSSLILEMAAVQVVSKK